jgi:trans-aconitate 2-methyltransferase
LDLESPMTATSFSWDPAVYRRFDDHRSRPFFDLVGRIGASSPRRVVDAGCGPGHLTTALATRWPSAEVVGFDTSAAMLADAPSAPGVRFEPGDVTDWDTSGFDVVVSNAVLQWVADGVDVLARWAAALPDDGWLAVQVPMNFHAPSHVLMREVGAAYPTTAAAFRSPNVVFSAAEAAGVLLDAGLSADVWETTYLHVLDGDDPVLRWVTGTGLRPVLAALSDDERPAFLAEYSARLREAYPQRPDGTTILPFRRLFVVGHRGGAS